MIRIPEESFEVSGNIRIQKGTKTVIRRFKKRDMTRNGPVDDPKFLTEILADFQAEVVAEASQTTLDTKEKPEPAQEKKKK